MIVFHAQFMKLEVDLVELYCGGNGTSCTWDQLISAPLKYDIWNVGYTKQYNHSMHNFTWYAKA